MIPAPATETAYAPGTNDLGSGSEHPMIRAVIFIGASDVSMMVAEVDLRNLRVLDTLTCPIELAHDIFRGGVISRDTMNRCVHIVSNYNELLNEYRLGGEVEVRLLASNVLLDVRNADTIINRLQIACHLQLEIMDDGEMTRLLYLNMKSMLERHSGLSRKRVMVLHVGPGNTRILLFDRGRITYYASYRMGAYRTIEAIGDMVFGGADHECAVIREHIRGVVEQIRHDADGVLSDRPDAMMIFGPDFHHISTPLFQGDEISTELLSELVDEIARTPYSQRQAKYKEDYASTGAILSSAVTYLSLAQEFTPETLFYPQEDFSHSFLRHLMPSRKDDFALEQEVLHFSTLLANRYNVDPSHSRQVRKLSTSLFDQLQNLHGLSRHDRLLLKVSAILHEIGTFINQKDHHLHGQYIILNSEIFGLSRQDINIVGLMARYHRHGVPTVADTTYAKLDQPTRLRLQKLAAILRVADAMERAHSGRINQFKVCYNNRRLELLISSVHDLTVENIAMRTKADLFTDIFGYDIQLMPAQQD